MNSLTRRLPLALLAAVALSACRDDALPTLPPAAAPATTRAQIACSVNVKARAMACAPAEGGFRGNLILGGQHVNVSLTSTGTHYDAATQEMISSVSVKNMLAQPIGTPDGITPYGAKVFFFSGPTVTSGSGTVTVANPDGVGTFTAANQPYFDYPGVIPALATTAPKTWRFGVPTTVETFDFSVYVETQLPLEQGVLHWVREQGGVFSSGTALSGVWASSERNAWVIASYTGHDRSILHYDGWQWRAVPVKASLTDIHGADPRSVYAVGGSTVLKYDGTGWKTLNLGAITSPGLNGVWASSPSEVWAVGGPSVLRLPSTYYSVGTVLHSVDGGQSWSGQQLPGPPGPGGLPYSRVLNDVSARGDTVVAVGSEYTSGAKVGLVLRSVDGGGTWDVQRYPAADGRNRTFHAVWSADATHFVLVGEGAVAGVVMRSSDAGASWTDVTPAGAYDLRGISGVDSLHFTAVGASASDAHQVLQTSDGGATWAMTSPGSGRGRLYGVSVLPSGAAFVVGDDDRPLRFDGTAWTEDIVNAGGNTLFSVWGSGPSRVYAVGSGPVLQRYDGTSWSNAALPASTGTRDLVDVSGSGSDTAFAVGSRMPDSGSREALVERTTDGGLTWTETSIRGTPFPCCTGGGPWRGLAGVSTPDGMHVFAVGSDAVDGPLIMRSSDGGATWTTAFVPANGRVLNDVWAMDADTIVVVGRQPGSSGRVEGVILRSTDGGANWTTTTWPGVRSDASEDQPLLDVWGAGGALYTVGWRLGSGYYESVIMSSLDGGRTWSQKVVSTPGASLQLEGITARAAGDVYAVGRGGMLVHFDGTTVLRMLSGVEADLNAAAAVATNNVYVVGTGAVRLHGTR